MSQNKPSPGLGEESFYDVLKIDRSATTSEITAAYHRAKHTFSSESVASYSLFSQEELTEMLCTLEQAYLTLSDLAKKQEYDEWLCTQPHLVREVPRPKPIVPAASSIGTTSPSPSQDTQLDLHAPMTGRVLARVRESYGLSLEDVARTTKISERFIEAIEQDKPELLPARVYLQGFLRNLAAVYHLDPSHTVKSYLDHFDNIEFGS